MVIMEDDAKDKGNTTSGNKSSVICVKLILFVFCVGILVFHFDCLYLMGMFPILKIHTKLGSILEECRHYTSMSCFIRYTQHEEEQ
jgi:hypothetical protein